MFMKVGILRFKGAVSDWVFTSFLHGRLTLFIDFPIPKSSRISLTLIIITVVSVFQWKRNPARGIGNTFVVDVGI